MLSISRPLKGANTANYYLEQEAGGHSSENEGWWFGHAATALGLIGHHTHRM